ncbi:MAG: hypothetical protein C0598_03410 [Marinilabiliales bacterium]|nr:MAG: hypothetical protein C0598_03410 [Marinilabiliales bacterium]
MKKVILALSVLLAVAITLPANSQNSKQINKDIKKRAMKDARKEAKKLKKEGFKVAPGQLPMDKQIEATWIKRYESDDKGNKKWFVADARSVGETHSAAKLQAYEVAKVNLAGQIGSEIAGLIETNIANAQLNSEEAASVTETVATFKSLVGSKLGRTSTFFEADRQIGKNTELYVTVGYSYDSAVEMAKEIIRKELKKKAEVQSDKLDKILDF